MQVTNWYEECLQNHPGCAKNEQHFHPTRVLELVDMDSARNGEYRIRLVENSGKEPYVALSHCWGTTQPLKTTISNYSAHQKSIVFDALPKSFQDAIVTVVHLKRRRLWIDSLCIIQDSKEDWERECAKMGDIYRYASCMIAICDAPDATHGFLKQYPSTTRCSIGPITVRYLSHRRIGNCNKFEIDEACLLAQRGWALQESLLSCRAIAFKAERTQLQCHTMHRSDDARVPYSPLLSDSLSEKPTPGLLHAKTPRQQYQLWLDVVRNYSDTKLTFMRDKLPALSGLAKYFLNMSTDNILRVYGSRTFIIA